MTSKEAIFEALNAARPEVFEKPDLSEVKSLSLRYEDPLAQFCEAVKGSGGKVLRIEAGDSPEEAARSLFPDADDICIAKGVFGVAENGCVYLEEPTDMPRESMPTPQSSTGIWLTATVSHPTSTSGVPSTTA